MNASRAAQAIVEIAITKMSLAVREVSVEKGYDPRDFVLVASGGAGPLHVLAIARELHIPTVIVPLFPSHFSALGMLLADERHDFVRTYLFRSRRRRFRQARRGVSTRWSTEAQARPAPRQGRRAAGHLDLRYVGQEFTLPVPVDRGAAQEGRPQRHPHGVRQALRAALRAPFARRAGRDRQHPARRHRQAAEADIPDASAAASATAAATPQVYLGDAAKAGRPARSTRAIARRRRAHRRPGADRGTRHDDGPLRRRQLPVAPSGELIIAVGAARRK